MWPGWHATEQTGSSDSAYDQDEGGSRRFPPLEASQARHTLLDVLAHDPRQVGLNHTRWTLDALGTTCVWLPPRSRSGIWRMLDALAIHVVRAREHLHSPDPDYDAKQAWIARCRAEVETAAGRIVLLYQDELTFYRQPTLAPDWVARGTQPRAERSYRKNTRTRLAGTLDATSGRVTILRRSRIGVAELVAFYQQVVAAYPGVTRLYLVQDNWPVHFHPDLLVALEPQETPFPLHQLSWSPQPSPRARERWSQLHLPIQLLPLPTYASWLNPIEKLWRLLKHEVLHLHRLADDLLALRALVDAFLAQFAHGSPDLLRYVGLEMTT